ncbi:Rieske 2Fe-2S domain-containing protein [Actinokineospora auranticolor]|uniref:Nitrite reductase/ring-hydroxylating ferredoxin subunit n=1 Tax=Actinokineospora auranticolor TaxID=155976 RepID=A0A2S6GKA8_9PSEU|nr:Rieske 2Fe-2S domain-containing protein [Actinokineospora auranticolor]PPK65620.1 nitrite reductase/ring-hydroxylating ferredoxin subunit [Actinokineospora auranticolor]
MSGRFARGRRRGPVGDQEAADKRAEVLLRAAGVDQGPPDEKFVEALRARLGRELEPEADRGRRRFVQFTSVAAASAAVGVAVDRLVVDTAPTAETPATVVPETGEWRAVVAGRDLPEGGVRPFDVGVLSGFVERVGGQVRGVSGVCTHLGCKLKLAAATRELDCPCHRTSFAVDGVVLRHQLPAQPRPLPKLLVRESGGQVEVFIPTTPA